jgi:CO/xanthine dehydrogenase FAD-binding subunit
VGIHHLQEFIRPSSLAEAIEALRRYDGAARPIGGGIDLVRFTPPDVRAFVDLTGLPLASIDEDAAGVHIGATTTLAAWEREERLAGYAGGVVPAMLRGVGSRQLRNLATVGGALVGAHPWSDVLPVAYALGGRVTIHDGSDREIDISDLTAARGSTDGGILTALHLPPPDPALHAAFVKFSLTAFDVAMLNVCVAVRLEEGGRCGSATIVIGGTPWLSAALEEAGAGLQGETLSDAGISAAASAAAAEARLGDDRRASAAYRRTLVEAGVRRALQRIADAREKGAS